MSLLRGIKRLRNGSKQFEMELKYFNMLTHSSVEFNKKLTFQWNKKTPKSNLKLKNNVPSPL